MNDPACAEVLLTVFTYDDGEISWCVIAAHKHAAFCSLLIDLGKAQSCRESGVVLQSLPDASVEPRTAKDRRLLEVYLELVIGAFREHCAAKTALVRCRHRPMAMIHGSHSSTKASRANREFVMGIITGESDANVAADGTVRPRPATDEAPLQQSSSLFVGRSVTP